ncbi:MAG TPA: carboxylating nicotinate-nucleotide diphosphorylase [Candidatus Binataceae bacterium]|nr:carboxylating nicotinate-nucleotide diphosphorylase [Candidatus Binataceae bacterium]
MEAIAGLNDLIERALAEDVGHGDVTTAATVTPGQRGRARITVKQDRMIFCGGPVLESTFRLTGAEPKIVSLAAEGKELGRGACAAEVDGLLEGLLVGERTALNFLQLMCGIASVTAEYVRAVAGTRARIIDTRKTHPGLRAIEKYAVRAGGGFNHRFALDSGVLIKENHIAAAGSVREAVTRASARAPHSLRVEIECETLEQVQEALAAGANVILLDNMTNDQMKRARAIAPPPVLLEVSGNVTLATVRAIAETGVDLISVGALTHSAPAADISMRVEPL